MIKTFQWENVFGGALIKGQSTVSYAFKLHLSVKG